MSPTNNLLTGTIGIPILIPLAAAAWRTPRYVPSAAIAHAIERGGTPAT